MLKINIFALLAASAVYGAGVPRHEDHSTAPQLPTTVPYPAVSATPVGSSSTGPILIVPVEPSNGPSGIVSIVPVEPSKSKSPDVVPIVPVVPSSSRAPVSSSSAPIASSSAPPAIPIVPVVPSSSGAPVASSSAPPAGSSSKPSVVFVTTTSYVTVAPSIVPSSTPPPGNKTLTTTVIVTHTVNASMYPSSSISGPSSGASSMYLSYGPSSVMPPSTNVTSTLSSSKKKLTKTVTVTETENPTTVPTPTGPLPSNTGFIGAPGASSAPASSGSTSVTKLPISSNDPSRAQPTPSAPSGKSSGSPSGDNPPPANTGNMGGFNYPKPSGAQRRDAVTGLTVAAQATGLPDNLEKFPIIHSAKAALNRRAVPSGAFLPPAPNDGLGPNWFRSNDPAPTGGKTLTVAMTVTVDVLGPEPTKSQPKKATGTPHSSQGVKPSSKPTAKSSAAAMPSSSVKPSRTAPSPTAIPTEGKHCPYPYPGEHCGGRKTTFATKTRKSSSSEKATSTKEGDKKPKETGWCPYPGQDC